MLRPPKITYFFGAGASHNSVPITFQLHQQLNRIATNIGSEAALPLFEDTANVFKSFLNQNRLETEGLNVEAKLFAELYILGKKSKEYSTIDTYALYNKYHNADNYNKIKHLINLFFTFWQTQAQMDHTGKDVLQWDEIDPRYINLISAIIRKEGEISIPDNINFITWNYDTQLEKAINLFDKSKTLLDICNKIKVYPASQSTLSKIIHLNGISGFLKKKTGEIELIPCDNTKPYYEKMKQISDYYSAVNTIEDSTLIKFSWDSEIANNEALKMAKLVIQESDYLIIVGYSFPLFNREADIAMLRTLPHKCKIIIQNPNITTDMFNEYFEKINPPKNNIIVKDASQFFVPSEYFTMVADNTALASESFTIGKSNRNNRW